MAAVQSNQRMDGLPKDFVFMKEISYNSVQKQGSVKVGLCEDIAKNRKCAIKKISKIKYNQMDINNIKSILDVFQKNRNRFIVEYLAFIQTPNHIFMVMEHLPNSSLRSWINPKTTYDIEGVRFYVGCVVLGLEYLHLKNIIHGDVNTNNIALAENGYAKLIDFESAKLVPSIYPHLFDDLVGLSGIMQDLLIGEHKNFIDLKSLGDTISPAARSVLMKLSYSAKSYNKDDCRMCLANVSDCEFFNKLDWYSLREGTLTAPQIQEVNIDQRNSISRIRKHS